MVVKANMAWLVRTFCRFRFIVVGKKVFAFLCFDDIFGLTPCGSMKGLFFLFLVLWLVSSISSGHYEPFYARGPALQQFYV